jgi:hypothetical protein
MALKPIHTVYSSLRHVLYLPGSLSLCPSSGTGFQRQTFPFLGSLTVPAPQPQQILTHRAINPSTPLELPPLVTGYVLQ